MDDSDPYRGINPWSLARYLRNNCSRCPVCRKGGLRETAYAFSCTEKGCGCTVWKDCLQKGGGPALTGKLMLLLLEKKLLRGSTGTLMIKEDRILFYPNGSEAPSVNRSLIYVSQK